MAILPCDICKKSSGQHGSWDTPIKIVCGECAKKQQAEKFRDDTIKNILDRKLSIDEQRVILDELFSFHVDDAGVIYDEGGHEFYGYHKNGHHDLTTMAGILNYRGRISYEAGQDSIKKEFKNFLTSMGL